MKKILSVFLSVLLFASFGILAGAECAHEYDATYYPPTCTSKGYTKHVCALCGEHYETFDSAPANGHSYGEWEIHSEPTCTQLGIKKQTCSVCGNFTTDTIPMCAHTDADDDYLCDACGFEFEQPDEGELSPYEWLKLLFANILAWFRSLFA
ncbi:MAG: hypothetical protein IKJ63_06415 [Clostridia bacterium]|nr:hypothetical protein [Clostridia bacterium]